MDILLSTYNERTYIRRCLDHILLQDYPKELLTVWFIDGGSTDDTVAVVHEMASRDDRIRIVPAGGRLNLPEALNLGIERSSAEMVAKIDAHGYPERDFISTAVSDMLRDPTLACAGGRPVQEGETTFGEAMAVARGSRAGVGDSEYGGSGQFEYVATVQCGVYRRAALNEVGAFDPAMNFGEDEELNWRLLKRGYRILLDTRIKFHYITRPTWRAAFRQYRNYGRARVFVVRKHPSYARVYHFMPAAFVLCLGVLTGLCLFYSVAANALAFVGIAYTVALAGAAFWAVRGRLRLIPAVIAAFTSLHFGYAIGMLAGSIGLLTIDSGRLRIR